MAWSRVQLENGMDKCVFTIFLQGGFGHALCMKGSMGPGLRASSKETG